MTFPAESITVEFEDEDGVWAPCSSESFWERDDDAWTPWRVRTWFIETAPPQRVLSRLLGPPMPMSLSTALPGSAMRYVVRGGLLFPKWAAMSICDQEALRRRPLPPGCQLESCDRAVFLHFVEPPPVPLTEPLGLVRCAGFHDDLHYYVDGDTRFSREPERFVGPSQGADGHL